MKYIVTLNGEKHDVILGPDGVEIDEAHVETSLSEAPGSPVRTVVVGRQSYNVVVRKESARGSYTLWVDGHRFVAEAVDERTSAIRAMTAAAQGPSGPAPIKAPMPGLVVRVNVSVGDEVEAGQGIVVMEAMKMENELRATGAGRVKRIVVEPGNPVEKGALLVELE